MEEAAEAVMAAEAVEAVDVITAAMECVEVAALDPTIVWVVLRLVEALEPMDLAAAAEVVAVAEE